jgi:hypothetical protein
MLVALPAAVMGGAIVPPGGAAVLALALSASSLARVRTLGVPHRSPCGTLLATPESRLSAATWAASWLIRNLTY